MDKRAWHYLSRTHQEGNCLIWDGAVDKYGYPRANIRGNGNIKVHRYIFEQLHGFAPDVVRHTCDNPRCLRLSHMIAGSQLENIQDRVARGRTRGHVMDQERLQVLVLRSQGYTYQAIADTLNIKKKRVGYILHVGG